MTGRSVPSSIAQSPQHPITLGIEILGAELRRLRCPNLGHDMGGGGKGMGEMGVRQRSGEVTLPVLQKNSVNIFFVFAWEFCIEKWRGFLVIFFWSPSPTKRSAKSPRKVRGKFGAKFGPKFEKFRKLSFCNFPDLREGVVRRNGRPKGRFGEAVSSLPPVRFGAL